MSGGDAVSHSAEDQITLIGEELRPEPHFHWSVLLFLLFKCAPWIVHSRYIWPEALTILTLTLFILLAIADVWLSRGSLGLALVGLSWDFDPSKGIVYQFEPYALTVDLLTSLLFWLGLGANAIASVVVSVIHLFQRHYITLAVMISVSIFHGFNVRYMVGSFQFAKRKAAEKKQSQTAGIAGSEVEQAFRTSA
jgi:hypothetical protein